MVTQTRDSKELLLEAALKVFSERGYDGASVKDIVESAGVNVSLISYHFGGKEGLYRALLESYALPKVALVTQILKTPESIEEFRTRIKLWLEVVIDDHIANEKMTKIIHRDINTDNCVVKEIFTKIFPQFMNQIINFFTGAKKKGLLRASVDSDIAASVFWGSVIHNVKHCELQEQLTGRSLKQPKYREKFINQVVDQLLIGIQDQAIMEVKGK